MIAINIEDCNEEKVQELNAGIVLRWLIERRSMFSKRDVVLFSFGASSILAGRVVIVVSPWTTHFHALLQN
jgi:hypothetical protein